MVDRGGRPIYIIVRDDGSIWNYRSKAWQETYDAAEQGYASRYYAQCVAMRVESLQGSLGGPLNVEPVKE